MMIKMKMNSKRLITKLTTLRRAKNIFLDLSQVSLNLSQMSIDLSRNLFKIIHLNPKEILEQVTRQLNAIDEHVTLNQEKLKFLSNVSPKA